MPRLKARFALRQIVHRTMITAGLPESMLAERIAAWESALPPYLKLAYLPNPGAVRLRLSAYRSRSARKIGKAGPLQGVGCSFPGIRIRRGTFRA